MSDASPIFFLLGMVFCLVVLGIIFLIDKTVTRLKNIDNNKWKLNHDYSCVREVTNRLTELEEAISEIKENKC